MNPTSYEYTINFKGFENDYFKEIVKRYCKLMLNTRSFSHVADIASRLREFFNFINKNCEGIRRIQQLTRNEIEQYLIEINLKGLKSSTVTGRISALEVFFLQIKGLIGRIRLPKSLSLKKIILKCRRHNHVILMNVSLNN